MEHVYKVGDAVCASPEVERYSQPIRLVAGTVGAGTVAYIANQLPADRQVLRVVGYGMAVACSAWNLMSYTAVRNVQGS
jgi:NAD/NADP transhydrogenase beta subunit